MGIEDQKEEREVLESIFPEEITDVSDTEFRVLIKLDVGEPSYDEDEDDDEEDTSPKLILNVQYPPDYPDEAPRLDITQPPNAPKHPYLDIQNDKSRLLDSLTDTITDNLGMQMIFTLVTVLKDSAELLIAERANAKQALADIEAAKVEEAENAKFQGEAVTRESFLAWRDKFRAELEEEERRKVEEKEVEDKKKRIVEKEKKLTGRELWQQGLVGKVDEEDEGDDLEVDKLKISAAS
ncbi:RWD-domain-containing protein [Dothidotthia symphoricarpi CBS 119687]|uniref:RWD-domain-containing protein n=1 Tax=Dothidotthia symphoricarpi CBS 119687 TaxID=1392245 RepID=A0A6A6AHY0_9PLEO|nr:RWD-domain-containing protein [Dothidotthia symphoricarpi CBS 119687]KAF2131592.1 RWD-domain-containing protein [Dothidotthia symphoricarpi CBS 119687]